ncbi:trehalose-phosphatase [Ensifer soli]|uniref:trehalose-phosphatase n=1 Tax=Ciceribacter sp. sgz301302 TaxID=3342379 RepID=UPI0035B9ECBF
MSQRVQAGQQDAAQPFRKEPPELAALSLYPDDWALFLDVDGTLVDLAVTPDAVVVPTGLASDLVSLSQRLNGALALVTGRSIAFIDGLLSPCLFPVAGLHGSERRGPDGELHTLAHSQVFERIKNEISIQAGLWEGVLLEDKRAAVALHYRMAPEREPDVEQLMLRCAGEAGPDWALQRGKMVIEIRPALADKGSAVESFLAREPFKGRRPMAIGDDITDEAMFDIVNARGGLSVRVGPLTDQTAARASFCTPGEVRAFLARSGRGIVPKN